VKKVLLSAIFVIGFLSVPGSSLGQAVNSKGKAKHIKFIPGNYQLTRIDTAINDSIRLIVQSYPLMDSYANDYGDVTPDSIECRYRDNVIEIQLIRNKKEIIKKTIIKSDFITDPKYWKNLVIFKTWIESVDYKMKQIKLRVAIGLPDLYNPVLASATIGYDGNIDLKLR
jgi:hypothetical protein